jgi:CheY-like chemotaxis protein
VEAAGAPEARDHLAGSLPECIVLDVRLSDTDGLALVEELRADRRTAAIPIVVTTALAMRTDRERILQAGVDAYLAMRRSSTKSISVQGSPVTSTHPTW